MEFEKLCEIACVVLKKDGFIGVFLIKDMGDSLIFYGGDPNEDYYGVRTVIVDKKSGEVGWYSIDLDNMNMIDKSPEIEVPSEYLYKAS